MGTFIDLTGEKFGKLTVISRAPNRCKMTMWKCQCECGAIKDIGGADVRSGHTTTCGANACRPQQKKLEVAGQKFGYLTATSTFEPNKGWLCDCICGNQCWARGGKLLNGTNKSCGCKSITMSIEAHTLPEEEALINYLFARYKTGAIERKLSFELSKEHFQSLVLSNCFYCGLSPRTIPKFRSSRKNDRANGIDRKNNNIGYTINNCVSSCITCNRAKNNLAYEAFIGWIDGLVLYQTTGDTSYYIRPENDTRTISRLYKQYSYWAGQYERCFDLAPIEFEQIITGICFYCGAEPEHYKMSAKYAANNKVIGIDRKDNNKGYTIDNSVSCCRICNRAKTNKPIQEFEEYITCLINYRKSIV